MAMSEIQIAIESSWQKNSLKNPSSIQKSYIFAARLEQQI